MKKIYTIIFVSCLAAISFSSCSDWLDVRPADEIKEEYLFETGNGYRTALNGIYRKLATFDLYGSNLSWGLIDGWGQVYDLDKAPDSGGGKAMKKLSKFLYKNSELTPTTDAMWSAAWNIIANCNNLAGGRGRYKAVLQTYAGEKYDFRRSYCLTGVYAF